MSASSESGTPPAADEAKPNEIVPDRGSPRVQARSEPNRFLALVPTVITITVILGAIIGGWLSWQAHRQAQEQNADGNVASKTSIGKRRNDNTEDSPRRLGADGEDPAAQKPPQVPAVEQENRRQGASPGQAQPIPVQGNGNGAPAAPPRSRYDAPMRFGSSGQDALATGQPPASPGYPGTPPSAMKAGPGTRPDYSVPPAPSSATQIPLTAGPVPKGALNLQTLKTPKAEASLIGNRNFILAKGASMDCDLDTAMRSNQPGMVRCTLIKDVWSDNGRVVLAERGSSLTGEYHANVQQGQAEIQVIWSRIKTPYGVVVNLASPATDALGRAGIDGTVDNHWGQRVGAAFLLSFVKDAIGYATATNGTNAATTGTVYNNSATTGESMADTILKQTINIPPTIERAQGTRVKVFVARDLDFSRVYELKLNRGPHAD
ncbi:type IV secretion system protein VirB10 [Propionivibrio sp.]|uniref:type IV secretion system protein VirB10 n=1 Tax=Propionivibrio sp. TaxID=2212460 RepID=UPI0039E40BBC